MSHRRLSLLAVVVFVGATTTLTAWVPETEAGDAGHGNKENMQAHVTVYLDQPILTEGGAVIMAGRPMPDEDWKRLSGGPNPSASDTSNPKREQVQPGDRQFGATASSPVTIVEFFYPADGTYTFNFLPAPAYRAEFDARLATERVLVGSSDQMPDPEGGYVDWPSVSTIAVIGRARNQSFARLADSTYSRALDDHPVVGHFEGVRTISLTPEQIEKYVRD